MVGYWRLRCNLFKYDKPTEFPHHRYGWTVASKVLSNLHSPNGVQLYDWADRVFKDKPIISSPWCGFFHNVLRYPTEYPNKYTGRIYPLTELVTKDFFLRSLESCKGIYTLSRYTANFLKRHIDAPIEHLCHPAVEMPPNFSWHAFAANRRVISAGQWLRRYHSIFELKTKYAKVLLKVKHFDHDYQEMKRYVTSTDLVQMLPHVSDDEYDRLLSSSVVLLDLYDVAACNVVIECIMKNTPILTTLLPSNVEYLGQEYPLFFETIEEAQEKLHNDALIQHAHHYLREMDKTRFSPEAFSKSVMNSNIFLSLPSKPRLTII